MALTPTHKSNAAVDASNLDLAKSLYSIGLSAFDPARGGALTHGGTFNNNAFTMSVGAVALEQLLTEPALDALFERGERLRARLIEVVGVDGEVDEARPAQDRGLDQLEDVAIRILEDPGVEVVCDEEKHVHALLGLCGQRTEEWNEGDECAEEFC